jgi:hypothetical protein
VTNVQAGITFAFPPTGEQVSAHVTIPLDQPDGERVQLPLEAEADVSQLPVPFPRDPCFVFDPDGSGVHRPGQISTTFWGYHDAGLSKAQAQSAPWFNLVGKPTADRAMPSNFAPASELRKFLSKPLFAWVPPGKMLLYRIAFESYSNPDTCPAEGPKRSGRRETEVFTVTPGE